MEDVWEDILDFPVAEMPAPIEEEPLPRRRVPKWPSKYEDYAPYLTTGLPHAPKAKTVRQRAQEALDALREAAAARPPPEKSPSPPPPLPPLFVTDPDAFGLYREYPRKPTLVPVENLMDYINSSNLRDPHTESASDPAEIAPGIKKPGLWDPFETGADFLLMDWQYTGSNLKSGEEVKRLIAAFNDPNFSLADAKNYDPERQTRLLDNWEPNPGRPNGTGWKECSVNIRVNCEDAKISEERAFEFEVPNVHYRSLVDVILGVFQDHKALAFTGTPYTQWWKPSDDDEAVRVYGELYTSDAMLEAQAEIDLLPLVDPTIENIIAAMMLWSDSTHLAQFGTASLWPVYLFFGNQSKYPRGQPSAAAAHHVAYMPSVRVST